MKIFDLVCLLWFFLFTSTAPGAQTRQEVFAMLVGPEINMDSGIAETVLREEHGKRHFIDSDGDGKVDTLYFVDTDERHGDIRQPLLVKVVDEDGDMYLTREPDTDSDLYIADWYGDGTVDRVIDYHDLDGDGDVDEQYLYQWSESDRVKRSIPGWNGERAYLVAWARDYGDDNRLWYHTNYEYGQRITQWKTDFNGDEMFVYLFFFDYGNNRLIPIWENAFSFYDLDGDTCSEEVVRFTGTGAVTNDLRYSMDIDNDSAPGDNPHDYDFSLSCIGPLDFPPGTTRRVAVRHLESEPVMMWERMRDVAKKGPWTKIHLTWDENDNNVDPLPGRMHHERWEGVLNHGSDYMPQVGGPSCGPFNKRNEVDMDASGGMQLYFSPVDDRLHLYGAELGWIAVDYDYNGTVDMEIRMDDLDGDGFFDLWKYDADGDGSFERKVLIENDARDILPFDYEPLHGLFNARLDRALESGRRIVDTLKRAVEARHPDLAPNEIDIYFASSLSSFDEEFGQGRKIRNSREGTRYYLDLIRERYWLRFVEAYGNKEGFGPIGAAYGAGDFERAARLVETTVLQ